MTINICLHPQEFTSKPGKVDAGLISASIASHNQTINFQEFVDALNSGKTWAPGTFKKDTRKAINWQSQQCFVADIDNDNHSQAEIETMCAEFDLPVAIIHESFSSNEAHRKWRLIFISKTPVTDPATALALLRKIQQHFNSDTAVIDLARLLYSCYNRVRMAKEVYFTIDDSLKLHEYLKPVVGRSDTKVLESFPETTDINNKKCQMLRNKAMMSMRYIGTQPRYQVLWHTTRLLAQSGLFSAKDIISIMNYGIKKSGKFADYDKDTNEIINTAMAWGKRHAWDE